MRYMCAACMRACACASVNVFVRICGGWPGGDQGGWVKVEDGGVRVGGGRVGYGRGGARQRGGDCGCGGVGTRASVRGHGGA